MSQVHITVEGVPVEAVIAEQESAEVEMSRRQEIKSVSFRTHIVSKQSPTKSGRSGKGRSVPLDDRMLMQLFNGGLSSSEFAAHIEASIKPKKRVLSATQQFYRMSADERRAYLQSVVAGRR